MLKLNPPPLPGPVVLCEHARGGLVGLLLGPGPVLLAPDPLSLLGQVGLELLRPGLERGEQGQLGGVGPPALGLLDQPADGAVRYALLQGNDRRDQPGLLLLLLLLGLVPAAVLIFVVSLALVLRCSLLSAAPSCFHPPPSPLHNEVRRTALLF